MVYNRKPILSTMVLFFILFIVFLFFIACEGMYPKPEPVTYVIKASAGNNGSIEPKGEIVVNEGQDQTFNIIPDAGYQINDVLINGESIGGVGEYSFANIEKDYTIEVIFKKKYSAPATPSTPTYYTINASSEIGGRIEPEGSIELKKGSSQTFTITSLSPCYEIKEVLIDGTSVGQPDSYTFDNIQNDCSIEVYFMLSAKKIRRYSQNGDLQCDNYNNIQDGINDASEGDIIIVCPCSADTYQENLVFDGSKKITVQSVEPETEYIVSATIIDGGAKGSIAHFGNGDESTLRGFTITNGSGTSTGTYTAGGGIYIDGSNPAILHNIIENNEAANAGGIFITRNSSPEIKNNIIKSNKSVNAAGGGIYVYGGSPDIIGNTIIFNSAHTNGGGVHIYDSSPHISENTISNNTAVDCGGGIYIEDSYSSETDNGITGNVVENNLANNGGGFYLNNSNPIIAGENLISGNIAIDGGGILIEGGSPKISNNRITENMATGDGSGINIKNSNPEIGGVDETDHDNFNTICSNIPQQIKSDSGTSYTFNDFGYTVSLSVNHGDYGIVTGEGNYCEGASVQIEAVPGEDYHFVNWTDDEGNGISTDNPYNFTMPAEDISITANFEIS